MKTKNIFRMLLVAAALLMGANNVKADVVNLWQGNATYETVEINKDNFTQFDSSAKYLYVYVGNANVQFLTTEESYDEWLWSSDDVNPWIYNANRYYNSDMSRYELPISSDILAKLKSKGFKVQGLGNWSAGLTQIDVYVESGDGTQTTTYSITIPNNIEHGTITADKTSGIKAGDPITLTATHDEGYELATLTVKEDASNNNVAVSDNYTFTMPASNVTVSATFTQSYSAPDADKHNLTFKTETMYAANWNSSTNTFTWGLGGDNSEWTFMAAEGIGGDLSNWTHLHLHVSNWTNASAKQLRVMFKENNGSWPPSGPTTVFEVTPNASGNIDINLENVEWNCDITKIQDLTIYGCARDDNSQNASVVVTNAYYVTTAETQPTTYYTVTVNYGSNGTASVDKASAAEGETVTITTEPIYDYEVDQVTVTGTTVRNTATNSYTFTMPSNNVTVTVSFKPITHDTGEYAQVYVGTTGYATFSSESALNFASVSGIKAYIATAVDDDREYVTLTQVRGVVAENTGLIIIKDDKQSTTTMFEIPKSNATGTNYDENLLLPSYENTLLSHSDGSYTYYVLVARNNVAKFAEVYDNDAEPGAGKAYLRTSKASHARTRGLSIKFSDGTTGISTVENEEGENIIYNLRGQRVENPTKGLYIINGKKVILK